MSEFGNNNPHEQYPDKYDEIISFTSAIGPVEEQTPLNEETITEFYNLVESEEIPLSNRLEALEDASTDLNAMIMRCFDTKTTVRQQEQHIEDIDQLQKSYALSFAELALEVNKELDHNEATAVMSAIMHDELVCRNKFFEKFYLEAEQNEKCTDDCKSLTYSLEGITFDIGTCLETTAHDSGNNENYATYESDEDALKHGIIEIFDGAMEVEIRRILKHLPSDSKYNRFSSIKDFMPSAERLPAIASNIGKVALGAALGAGVALYFNKKRK